MKFLVFEMTTIYLSIGFYYFLSLSALLLQVLMLDIVIYFSIGNFFFPPIWVIFI
jgi:hypothetical protein